jgi:hypothetical protein
MALGRAGYILGIAFLFRLTNWAASLPHADVGEITKVDILNCMGVGMGVFSAAALFRAGSSRVRFGAALGVAIAAAAPVMANLPWGGVPSLLREYLVPGAGRGRFPLFPFASYIGFGLAAGTVVKNAAMEAQDRLMQWCAVAGFGLVFTAQYFSNIPYSLYSRSDFWTDSPALILIRTGIILATMSGVYLWTGFRGEVRWSWMECLGRNSLLVYWVHVMLVYGDLAKPLKRSLGIGGATAATLLVTALMTALSAGWMQARERLALRKPLAKAAD